MATAVWRARGGGAGPWTTSGAHVTAPLSGATLQTCTSLKAEAALLPLVRPCPEPPNRMCTSPPASVVKVWPERGAGAPLGSVPPPAPTQAAAHETAIGRGTARNLGLP